MEATLLYSGIHYEKLIFNLRKMKIKSITIYRPDGKAYLEVGRNLLNEEGKETDVRVVSIRLLFGKIKIKFSNGENVVYGKFPYIATRL
jgi:hypothetical protein